VLTNSNIFDYMRIVLCGIFIFFSILKI